MKAYLMFRDKDFKTTDDESSEKKDLSIDLELEYIYEQMAQEDEMIYATSKQALLNPLVQMDDIQYRQDNLSDVLENPNAIRSLYEIIVQTEKERKSSWGWFSMNFLSSTFSSSVGLLTLYIKMLHKLRLVADDNIDNFHSEGFRNLLLMLQKELNDEYINTAKRQLTDLKDSEGVLISSTIGSYLQGVQYVLRQRKSKGFWRRWLFSPSYTIAERDIRGAKDLGERRKRAINEPSNALAQAAVNLENFFAMLRRELAFYVGCLNLSEVIKKHKMEICRPDILSESTYNRTYSGLYDLSLLLTKKSNVIGNEINTVDKELYLITGANQGGKTTFLRSVGQAQLMAQCGMFVCANEFTVPIRNGIFTHFKREEDKELISGKLDEELKRMSEIVNHLNKSSLILLNESFASTNEREGSEINNQITRAFIENNVEVFSVTHLYTYASSFTNDEKVHYLRAERLEDGSRTFKIVEGEPLVTAYGEDLYRQIFVEKNKEPVDNSSA